MLSLGVWGFGFVGLLGIGPAPITRLLLGCLGNAWRETRCECVLLAAWGLLLARAVGTTHKEGGNARFLPLHIVKCILWAKWDMILGVILENVDLWVVFGPGFG